MACRSLRFTVTILTFLLIPSWGLAAKTSGVGLPAPSVDVTGGGVVPAGSKVFRVTGREVPELAILDGMVKQFMEKYDVERTALAITHDGRLILSHGYTWAPEEVTPTQPTTIFRTASCSKPVTALAIHRLMQEGHLTRQSLVGSFVDLTTRIAGLPRDERLEEITVDHLLTHSGGWAPAFEPVLYEENMARALGVEEPISRHDVRVFMNSQPLQFEPGSRYSYSNYGMALLGQVIEAITGESYADSVRRLVFQPLGISRPRIAHSVEDELFPGEAGYDHEDAYGLVNLETWEAAGGWAMAAPDYARMLTIFDDPEANGVIDEETMLAMLEERFRGGIFGILRGWRSWVPSGEVVTAYGHTGEMPGTVSQAFWRDDGTAVVLLVNRTDVPFPELHRRLNGFSNWPDHDLWEEVGIQAGAPALAATDGWLPVASRAPGAEGSFWQSDLLIRNRSNLANVVWLRTGHGDEVQQVEVELGPGESRVVADLLAALGVGGTTSVRLLAAEPVSAFSRLFSRETIGTLGQRVGLEVPGQGLEVGDAVFVAGLAETPETRSNLGLFNGGRRRAVVQISIHDSAGLEIFSRTCELAPGELLQLNRPLADVAPVASAWARLEGVVAEGVVAWGSVIDNRTNDPTTVPALPADAATSRWLPVVAHADGAEGSRWRSDVVLLAPGPGEAAVEILVDRDRGEKAMTVDLVEREQQVLNDVLGEMGVDGAFPLELRSSGNLIVFSRTFNQDEGGTYGQALVATRPLSPLRVGEIGWLVGLIENDDFRSNVGLAAVGDEDVTVRLTPFDSAGYGLSPTILEVGSAQLLTVPLRSVVGESALEDLVAAVRLELLAGGSLAAYGSVVDNRTNDPTTVDLQR